MKIQINGRGHLTATARPVEHGVIVRVDDTRNLEFWAELYVSIPQLMALAESAQALTEAASSLDGLLADQGEEVPYP